MAMNRAEQNWPDEMVTEITVTDGLCPRCNSRPTIGAICGCQVCALILWPTSAVKVVRQ